MTKTPEETCATNIADQIEKGLVTYERARKQLVAQGSRAGNTIDIGNVIEWLDKKVKRAGHEEGPDGISTPVDHSGYYTGGNEDGANMIEQARQNALETKQHPNLVHRPGMPQINMQDFTGAQERAIDVSRRVAELTARAEDELGIIDADE